MKLTDHESDPMAALRLSPPTPETQSAAVVPESWLDKLARHLGVVPVDHVLIPPTSFAPAKTCGADVSCSG